MYAPLAHPSCIVFTRRASTPTRSPHHDASQHPCAGCQALHAPLTPMFTYIDIPEYQYLRKRRATQHRLAGHGTLGMMGMGRGKGELQYRLQAFRRGPRYVSLSLLSSPPRSSCRIYALQFSFPHVYKVHVLCINPILVVATNPSHCYPPNVCAFHPYFSPNSLLKLRCDTINLQAG